MKLILETAKNPLYQKVLAYNSRNVPKNISVLDIVCVDEETNQKFTIGQLFENLYKENQELKEELERTKKQIEQNYDTQINLIEALKNETREKGVL